MNQNLFSRIKHDVLSSIVVFLIAVPLSLGIALASGAPMTAGIIAAVVGGIVAGALGGAPLQVSGPAAGMTVIVFGVVQKLGWPAATVATALAGLIQVVLGRLKVARIVLAIPPAVVYGMLAGIGVTIATAQLQVVLGKAPAARVVSNLAQLPGNVATANGFAVALGALTLAILLLWSKLPKAIRGLPSVVVAVLVPSALAFALRLPVKRIELPEQVFATLGAPAIPSSLWLSVLLSALVISLVASVESLLSAVATDKMHAGARADLDRELVGQGSANLVSGLLGGLPVTGVIVRSSANIHAGARTRLSSILHGVWVLLFVLALGGLLRQIPLAVLAALLIYVGVKLVDAKQIRSIRLHGELAVYLVTLIGVAGFDLISGVAAGMLLSMLMVLRRIGAAHVRVRSDGEETHVFVDGSLTLLNVPELTRTLYALPPRREVRLEIWTDFMDNAAFEALRVWERGYTRAGGRVTFSEPHEEWYEPAARDEPRIRKSSISRRSAAAAQEVA